MSDAFYQQLAVWSQIVASILFIVALLYIWNRFIAPAVVAAQARKNAELAEAERQRDAARLEVDDARGESTRADEDVRSIRARAEGDAHRTRERIAADARAEGERLMRSAEGELERSRAVARDDLRTQLLERAMQIARLAATRLDGGTDRRLVDDALTTAERGER